MSKKDAENDSKNDIKKEIGKRIKYIKDQKGMNIQEFANYINTTKQQVSYVIKGERGFSISKLVEISKITGYPIEFILTGKTIDMDEKIKKQIEDINEQIKQTINSLNNIISLMK